MNNIKRQPGVGLRLAILLLAICLGLVAGPYSAWLVTGKAKTGSQISNGQWKTAALIGTSKADPYTRAHVARIGIWALPSSEVIYFQAEVDDKGQPLLNTCSYRVEGGDLPTRWWSITLYRDNFWVANKGDRYSIAKTNIKLEPDGAWVINVNRNGEGANGLPMGDKAGHFDLSLRFYHPDSNVAADRATVHLPVVRRLSCG